MKTTPLPVSQHADTDPQETAEWPDALDYVIARAGRRRTEYLRKWCSAPMVLAAAMPGKELRRFFEVDPENVALAALVELAREGKYPREKLAPAIKTLGLDRNKLNPVTV